MTEKEKCRLGLLYDANYDPEILADRERAKELLYDYNHLRPSKQIGRTELLKKLLGKTGENLIVEPPFTCDYGYNIEVGENFYANVNLVILDGAKVCIGDNAFIAPNGVLLSDIARALDENIKLNYTIDRLDKNKVLKAVFVEIGLFSFT